MAPDPPVPYRLVMSDAVRHRLAELSAEATARGDGPVFKAALQRLLSVLAVYPQFGDPQIDMVVGGGHIRQAIIRPLSMRYGVNEEERLVFCAASPELMPMDKPDQ
jgi:hypothetical protein